MNFAPNQQNSNSRVPQVHPPPVNSAMSSERSDIMQNQSSFPMNQPMTAGHHQLPQTNNNLLGMANSIQQTLQSYEIPPALQKFTEFVHQMQVTSTAHQQPIQNFMQKMSSAPNLPVAQNQVKAGSQAPMNYGSVASPLRQLSPAKATHPQLKTTPTTSKPPQITGNNLQKPQIQPSAQVSAVPQPTPPPSLNSQSSTNNQKPASSPQDKNVPSTPPQSTQNPAQVAKKTSPIAIAQTASASQKAQPPVASTTTTTTTVPPSPQKPALTVTPVQQTPPKIAVTSPSTTNSNSSDAKSTEKPSNTPVKSSPPANANVTPTVVKQQSESAPKSAAVSSVSSTPTTTKSDEKKTPQIATTPTTPKSSLTSSADNKLTSPLSKSTLRLATVTPPRQKKPPPTRKSATGVEKQTPIRALNTSSTVAKKSPAVTPKASNSTPSETSSPKVKRSRVQVQPYQCPTRNLELATKLSTKSLNQEKKESELDKLIVFYK
jgi:hypothetical protein